jgi:hypothetical protein
MRRRRYLLTLTLLCTTLCVLAAQEPAAAVRSLVLFSFSPGDSGIPAPQLAECQAGMRQALADRGGYRIEVLGQALAAVDAAALFDRLKALRGTGPQDVTVGGVMIPAAEVGKLLAAEVCIVPWLAAFTSEEEEATAGIRYKVRLKTTFEFFIRAGDLTRETRTVETMGYDVEADRALADAIKTILPQFVYEAGSLLGDERQASILALVNGEVFVDMGWKQGVALGSEFSVKGSAAAESGRSSGRGKALLTASEVTEDVSVGVIAYDDGTLEEGDAVEEIPRLGIELTPYAYAFIPWIPAGPVSAYAGLRVTLAKGVYTLRPFIAVETLVYPFSTYQWWFPLRPFVGAEIRLRLGRVELAALPMIGVEEWFALAPGYTSTFIGFGLRGVVQVALLISRDVKLFLEGGYEYWFGTREGFLAGGGISFKL